MWSAMPGWLKFTLIVVILAWLGLIPATIHLLISLADSLKTAAHTAVPSSHGLTPLRSMMYHR